MVLLRLLIIDPKAVVWQLQFFVVQRQSGQLFTQFQNRGRNMDPPQQIRGQAAFETENLSGRIRWIRTEVGQDGSVSQQNYGDGFLEWTWYNQHRLPSNLFLRRFEETALPPRQCNLIKCATNYSRIRLFPDFSNLLDEKEFGSKEKLSLKPPLEEPRQILFGKGHKFGGTLD